MYCSSPLCLPCLLPYMPRSLSWLPCSLPWLPLASLTAPLASPTATLAALAWAIIVVRNSAAAILLNQLSCTQSAAPQGYCGSETDRVWPVVNHRTHRFYFLVIPGPSALVPRLPDSRLSLCSWYPLIYQYMREFDLRVDEICGDECLKLTWPMQ